MPTAAPISVSILLHKWGLRPQAPALIHTRELGSAEKVAIGEPPHVLRWRHGGMEVAESDEGASTNFSREDGRARRRCATLSLRSPGGLCTASALTCTRGGCPGSGGCFAPRHSHGKCCRSQCSWSSGGTVPTSHFITKNSQTLLLSMSVKFGSLIE